MNYLRVPAFVSAVLFLVRWPLILPQGGHYAADTHLPADGFLARRLLITAALFLASALVLIARTWLRLQPERKQRRAQARARRATKWRSEQVGLHSSAAVQPDSVACRTRARVPATAEARTGLAACWPTWM